MNNSLRIFEQCTIEEIRKLILKLFRLNCDMCKGLMCKYTFKPPRTHAMHTNKYIWLRFCEYKNAFRLSRTRLCSHSFLYLEFNGCYLCSANKHAIMLGYATTTVAIAILLEYNISSFQWLFLLSLSHMMLVYLCRLHGMQLFRAILTVHYVTKRATIWMAGEFRLIYFYFQFY